MARCKTGMLKRSSEGECGATAVFYRRHRAFHCCELNKDLTTGIPDGEHAHKLHVAEVTLKAHHAPKEVMALVTQTNPHKLLFACTFNDEICLAVMPKRIAVGKWRGDDDNSLVLKAASMDGVWDSIASQVAYSDTGSETTTAEERFVADAKLKALRDELAREETCGRKNALFDKAKELKRQIAAIEEGR